MVSSVLMLRLKGFDMISNIVYYRAGSYRIQLKNSLFWW
jgi:hypothetical protein